jgi:hypothetical protein
MPRNDKRRLSAHYTQGCPGNLYASFDNRVKCFLVKTYVGQLAEGVEYLEMHINLADKQIQGGIQS